MRKRRPNRDSEFVPGVRAPIEFLDFLHASAHAESDACVLWPYTVGETGYGRFSSKMDAHRYVCFVVNGPPPVGDYEAAHDCGARTCVNGRHLQWKTPGENNSDIKKHGRQRAGETHPCAKISDFVAQKIATIPKNVSDVEVAAHYGISRVQVNRLRRGIRRAQTEKMPVFVHPGYERQFGHHWAVRRVGATKASKRFKTLEEALQYASSLGVPVSVATEIAA